MSIMMYTLRHLQYSSICAPKPMQLIDILSRNSSSENKGLSTRLTEFRKKLKEIPFTGNRTAPPGRQLTPLVSLDQKTKQHPKQFEYPSWPENTNPHTGEINGPKGPEPTRTYHQSNDLCRFVQLKCLQNNNNNVNMDRDLIPYFNNLFEDPYIECIEISDDSDAEMQRNEALDSFRNLEFSTWIADFTKSENVVGQKSEQEQEQENTKNTCNNNVENYNVDVPMEVETIKLTENEEHEEAIEEEIEEANAILDNLLKDVEEHETNIIKDLIQRPSEIQTAAVDSERIPLISILKPGHKDLIKLKHESTENKKVLPMLVKDIKFSQIVTRQPYLYFFMGDEYKYTKILGTVVRIHRQPDRLCFGVDDGTGIMACIRNDPKMDDFSYKNELEKDIEIFKNKKINKMAKKDIINLSKVDDETFERNANQGNFDDETFLNSFSDILLQRTTKCLQNMPLNKDITFGDTVAVVGKVTDLHERLIFAWQVKKVSPYLVTDHLNEINARNTAYLNENKPAEIITPLN